MFTGSGTGLLRSADGGQSWQIAQLPPPPPVVTALAVSKIHSQETGALTFFAVTMEDGKVYFSPPAMGWTGLLDLNVLCLTVSPDYAQDETLFAGTDSGISAARRAGLA